MPSDDEFVACVDRKKSYGTPILHIWYNKTYNLVVVVLLLGLGLVLILIVAVAVVVVVVVVVVPVAVAAVVAVVVVTTVVQQLYSARYCSTIAL